MIANDWPGKGTVPAAQMHMRIQLLKYFAQAYMYMVCIDHSRVREGPPAWIFSWLIIRWRGGKKWRNCNLHFSAIRVWYYIETPSAVFKQKATQLFERMNCGWCSHSKGLITLSPTELNERTQAGLAQEMLREDIRMQKKHRREGEKTESTI